VSRAAKDAIAPLYLLACLLLGGSAQGAWQNMTLQLAGLAILAWAAIGPAEQPISPRAKALLLLAIAAIAVIALQMVPLPSSILTSGRGAMGTSSISLTPYETLGALLCLIPPLATFCAIAGLRAYRPSWLAAALVVGAVAGITLGALQVTSANPGSPWYLYPETNYGLGVGFFANANHMATLLVITIAFVAAIAAGGRSRNIQRYSALLSILAGALLVLLVGIALNGSLAGYALALPVLAASASIVVPARSGLRRWLMGLAAISVLAAVVGLSSSSIGGSRIGQSATTSVQSRAQILSTTGKAIADYLPLGSGLGSFVRVYPLMEKPESVTSVYVIHAHNDYAEIALELGAPGILLMLLFMVWWFSAVFAVWRRGEAGPYARAASIASAAILIHSLVDFPLRTAAISACFAMCLAMLSDRRQSQRQEATNLRPSRHLVIR
jgi:O-antigen ligase